MIRKKENPSLQKLSHTGYFKQVEQWIKENKSASRLEWNVGLYAACQGGHLSIAQLIAKGASDFNYGLWAACECDHLSIVQLMIEKGATDSNGGLHHACSGGHIAIVKLMMDKGATKIERFYTYPTHKTELVYLLDHGISP